MPSIGLRITDVLVTPKQEEEGKEYLRKSLEGVRKKMLAERAISIAKWTEDQECPSN